MESQTSLYYLLLLGSLLTCACSEDLLTCLSQGNVTNITTYYTSDYLRLLNSSTQNLRFLKPIVNKPIAVVFPENKYQVQTAIRCSRQGSWEIRIRCGGHSNEGLSSFADKPFVIIDLMNLDQVTVDLESETAWVEGGATLGQLYYAIAMASNRHGFSAGICPTVGSGGHISGGGYGALIRKYGVAADHVLDAVLIDADGRVLDRKSMGKEVFWAIRGGGGGNWGVVVAWKIRLLRVPENVTLFGIDKSGNTSEAAQLLYKWQLVAPKLDENFFLQVPVVRGTIKTTDISMFFIGFYLGPKASALAIISKAFPELGVTLQDCKEMSWAEGAIFANIGDPNVRTVTDLKNRFSFRKTFSKVKSDYVKVPIPSSGLEGALEILAKQPKVTLMLDPYGGINDRIKSDVIPFPHRAGTLYSIEYVLHWDEADDGKSGEYLDGIRRLYEYMGPFFSEGPRAVYVNKVDLDLGVMDWSDSKMNGVEAVEVARAWCEKYFLRNYDRLVRAKTSIDPNNVFRHPQSIPPLVNREGLVYYQ